MLKPLPGSLPWLDVTPVEKHLTVFDPGVTVGNIDLAGPYRFDLRTLELNTTLVSVRNMVVTTRLSVGCYVSAHRE